MAKVVFIDPELYNRSVVNSGTNTIFIANDSRSNRIIDNDHSYYKYNAVVKGEIKSIMVDSETANAATLNGFYNGYNIDKYGAYYQLTSDDTSASYDYEGGTGISKTSKEYTVTFDGTKTYTVADDAKIFYVDLDGKITESSYAGIVADDNDLVYAVINEDAMVSTLVIEEVKDDNTVAVTFACEPGAEVYVNGKAVTDPVKVEIGKDLSFTVDVDDDYNLGDVKVGDTKLKADANGVYTLKKVQAATTVDVGATEKYMNLEVRYALSSGAVIKTEAAQEIGFVTDAEGKDTYEVKVDTTAPITVGSKYYEVISEDTQTVNVKEGNFYVVFTVEEVKYFTFAFNTELDTGVTATFTANDAAVTSGDPIKANTTVTVTLTRAKSGHAYVNGFDHGEAGESYTREYKVLVNGVQTVTKTLTNGAAHWVQNNNHSVGQYYDENSITIQLVVNEDMTVSIQK